MSLPRRSFNRIALHHPQLPSALYVVCRFICLYLSIPLLIPGFYILSKLLWSVFACVGVFADSCLPFICSWVSWELWPSSLSPIFLSTPLLIAFFRFSFFWIFLHSPLPLSASYSSILFLRIPCTSPFSSFPCSDFAFSNSSLLSFFLHSFSTSYYSVCSRMSSFSSSTSYISWYMPVSSPFHSLFFLVLPYPILFFPSSYDRVRLGTPLNQCDFSMHIQ